MKHFASILKSIVFLLIFGSIGFGAYYLLNQPAQQPEVITHDIEATISDIGELATSEYRYTISQSAEKPKLSVGFVSIPLTGTRVLYSYQGVIKAGIQFGDITINVNDAQNTVYVELPEPEILSEEVFQDSLIVYDEAYSIFNTLTFEDMNLSVSNLKKTALDDAIKNGLIDSAYDNAVTIINSTISSFYNTDEYEIEYY